MVWYGMDHAAWYQAVTNCKYFPGTRAKEQREESSPGGKEENSLKQKIWSHGFSFSFKRLIINENSKLKDR